jgi:formylglycine-generating enzyme required for sulfatase activity
MLRIVGWAGLLALVGAARPAAAQEPARPAAHCRLEFRDLQGRPDYDEETHRIRRALEDNGATGVNWTRQGEVEVVEFELRDFNSLARLFDEVQYRTVNGHRELRHEFVSTNTTAVLRWHGGPEAPPAPAPAVGEGRNWENHWQHEERELAVFRRAAEAAGRKWRVAERDAMPQVLIPAGEFRMGAAEDEAEAVASERPRHRVFLRAYWIDQHDVTVGQYAHFCRETGAAMPPQPAGSTWDQPVVDIDWERAAAYCRWAGRELPSEAEWERAARGGREYVHYPWGETFEEGRCAHNGANREPVAKYPANGYGVYDMVGNVWQWCRDWYDPEAYRHLPERDPVCLTDTGVRAVRGGSYSYSTRGLRLAFRASAKPDRVDNSFGFRGVQTAE